MNKNEIAVRLVVNDDGSVAIKQFGQTTEQTMKKASQSTTGLNSAMQTLKTNWLAITAGAAAFGLALSKAWSLAEKAADYEERISSIAALGAQYDMSAKQIVEATKNAARGLISFADSADMSARALNIGLNPQQIAEFTRVAEQLTDVVGGTIPDAFNNMTTAAATGRTMTLAQMGMIVDLEGIYDSYARQIGKTVEALTEQEKQQARVNGILDIAKEKTATLGEPVDTTRDKMDRLKVTLEDMKLLLGQALIRAGVGFVGVLQTIAAGAQRLQQGLYKIIQGYHTLMGMAAMSGSLTESYHKDMAANWGKAADGAGAGAAESWQKAKDNFSAMIASTEDMASAQKSAAGPVRDSATEAAAAAERQKKALEDAAAAAIKVAEEDKKTLEGRLGEAQKYYDSLQAMLDRHVADERRAKEEIVRLRQEQFNYEKTAADALATIQGSGKNLTDKQRYEQERSALTQQFLTAANMEGAARIKALDEYVQRVVAIQQQFQGGVMGEVFGKPEAIIAAKDVMEDASADVNRALNLQRVTTDRLADAQQNMAEESAAAHQEVQAQARNTLAEIERLRTMIADISALIAGMQKTIELTGVDNVSPVINEIIAKLAELHRLAQQPINLGAMAAAGASEEKALGQYAAGTDYVPQTGIYKLHQGEAVIPAAENKSRGVNINGDIVIHVPASAAADRPEDWRMITRQFIVPELRKLQ